MSDNSQFKEINQQKLQEILTQENRTAVELDTATTFQNPEFYSMERTIEDNRFITDVLSKMEVGELQLTEEQKVNLLNKKSRNQSHILVNQQKFTGDSTLMRRVKEEVIKIEGYLKDDSDNSITLQFLREAYSNAIKACEDYCAKKNPYFAKGKARKRMVQEQLETLRKEQILLDNALTAVENQEIERPKTIRDLIEQGYALEEQKKSPKKTVAEEKKDEVIEEKQKEKEIVEVTTEVTEEKQTEKKIEEEKPVVVTKSKEEIEKEREERKKEVNASMLEKLKNIPKVSQAKIDEANKVMEDSRTELKKYVKEPTEHIKTKVMDGNTALWDRLESFRESVIEFIAVTNIDRKTGQTTFDFNYQDSRKLWRDHVNHGSNASKFDGFMSIAKKISNNPVGIDDGKKADELISTMDALYNEVNKDCPLIQEDKLEAMINKLNSKSYIEQKQAYSFLQNYIQAIEKWDVDTKKKLGNKGSHDMSYDMEQIYKALHLMLTYYGEANPVIAQMTEEEVAAYEEYMETPEQKEEKRRKKAEEANAAASRRGERMMDAISLESVKGKKATDELDKAMDELDKAMEKRQERIKEEERIKKEEEERIKAEEKRIKEEEERRKAEEKRIKEEEERRKEEERRIEEERQREEARKAEVAKRIKEEQKRRAEEEEKLRRKEEEDYQKEKLAQVQINEGLLVYEKYQEMVKRLCKNGTVNFRAADKEKDLSETEKVLLPLMSEQGCTWDVLMNAARMGAYAAKYYEGDYTKIPSMGYKMAFELLYTLISDLLGVQDLDVFQMSDYIPKPEAVANMKLKLKENGLVVLPEEARVRVAGIMKYFEDQEKKVMGSSGYKDLMENMFTNYFKEVREAGGFLRFNDVDVVMGRDYIGENFLHDKMKEMAPDILRKHPELAG